MASNDTMNKKLPAEWDPRSEEVLDDQIAAYDEMRRRCPVAYSDYLQWSVFRHADVVRVLTDHETFSNAVSGYLSVPNGMDPPRHTAFRRIIDPYFGPGPMRDFEPACRDVAERLAQRLPAGGEIELVGAFAEDFALQVQSAFMGWPADLHEPLRQWTRRNKEATLAGDRTAMAAVAQEFDGYIRTQLDVRRSAGQRAPADVTTSLLAERVDGRQLTDEEIVSLIRNWTVGELASISASVGIIAHSLAERPGLQQALRRDAAQLTSAIDEILRIHAPLISNRRVATRQVEIGGRTLEAGTRLSLIWASANRDEAVFGDPERYDPAREPSLNLLYGAGIHACPGAPLARLELRIVTEALLAHTRRIALVPGNDPVRARYPASGFAALPLWTE